MGCLFKLPMLGTIDSDCIESIRTVKKKGVLLSKFAFKHTYRETIFEYKEVNWEEIWTEAKCRGWKWTDGKLFRLRA